MKQSIIKLKSIFHERDHVVLDHLDWTVEEGENWIVMGANGCGKSSLMHMITGYLYPTRGEIKVLEGYVDDLNGWPDRRLHIAVVSSYIAKLIEEDQYAGDVVLTGCDGSLNFWKDAEPEDVEKTRKVLTQIDAWDLCDREWGVLSQGERQKILIGRAIMNEAKIIVLDEPCAGLDPVAREHFLQFLERVMRENPSLTVIMVTHHVEEIMPSFNKILMIKDGKATFCGEVKEVLHSNALSEVFGAEVSLEKSGDNRYYSRVLPDSSKVF